jgi:hypothetical protein
MHQRRLAQGRSPVFEFLPGYPAADPTRASSFRGTLETLSKFQADVLAARSQLTETRRSQALELRDRLWSGGPAQTVVALELVYLLRDCTDWQTTLEFIDRLPAELTALPLVKEQRALAQSKAGDHHAAIGALRALIELAGDSSERRGLLGGRFKKLSTAASIRSRRPHIWTTRLPSTKRAWTSI